MLSSYCPNIYIAVGAGHRFVTSDQPLLAIWIRTGKLEGKYWFVGHEDVAQIGENWQQST